MSHKMTDIANISSFLLAGRTIITLKSEQTQKHFTYRVNRDKKSNLYFVSVFGYNNYSYLGCLYEKPSGLRYTTTARSQASPDAPSQQAFALFINNLNRGRLHSKLSVYHEDRCGRCGKPLTDPDSIERGLGPTCATK